MANVAMRAAEADRSRATVIGFSTGRGAAET
jgi:hypothetical protein